MNRSRSHVRPAVIAALVLLLPSAGASAQGPLAPPLQLEISVSGGFLVPATSLADETQVPNEVRLADSPAVGGGLGLLLPGGLNVEAQGLYAPGADLETAGASDRAADFLALTGNLVYRLPLPFLQPFLGAGAGVRQISTESSAEDSETQRENDFTVALLAGTYLSLVPDWRIRLEIRDYLSSFAVGEGSKLQNDLAFLAGMTLRFP